jgi:protein O-mannosyl-transferase
MNTDNGLRITTRFLSKPAVKLSLVLILLTMTVYWPLPGHEFINFDDDAYVTLNPKVNGGLSLDGLKWAFTTQFHGHWHPLTWLSHMTDVTLFGKNPFGHHSMSLLLHLLNILLLFAVLYHATGLPYRSFLVAALFACHPLNVEPTAWIAGRKDLLTTFFFLITILSYIRYAKKPGLLRYVPLFIFFPLALMAKPMSITLPVLLLLLDFWPLSRITNPMGKSLPVEKRFPAVSLSRAIVEKAILVFPVFFSAAMTITAITRRDLTATRWTRLIPDSREIIHASVSYLRYLENFFWPQKLAVYYTFSGSPPLYYIWGAAGILCLVTALSLYNAKKRPYLLVGWMWFIIGLIPVIGLFHIGPQVMADRYAYIPCIGLIFALVWTGAELSSKWRLKPVYNTIFSSLLITILIFLSGKQLHLWENSLSLFTHAVAVTDHNFKALNNLGIAHGHEKAYGKAAHYLYKAREIQPRHPKVNYNLGIALSRSGKFDEAIHHFQKAIRFKPNYAKAHDQLGDTCFHLKNYRKAIFHYNEVIRLQPRYFPVYKKIGTAYMIKKRWRKARWAFSEAIRLRGNDPDVLYRLGMLTAQADNPSGAVFYLLKAVKIQPDFIDAHYQIGLLLMEQQKFRRSISHFSRVLKIRPNHAGARSAIARAAINIK